MKKSKLIWLRLIINCYDSLLVKILTKRLKVALKIERRKREMGESILNNTVEIIRLEQVAKLAKKQNINKEFPEFIIKLFSEIIAFSRKIQEEQRKSASHK